VIIVDLKEMDWLITDYRLLGWSLCIPHAHFVITIELMPISRAIAGLKGFISDRY